MNKKKLLQYVLAAGAFCIPSPARFAYGFILLLVFNILILALTFIKYWITICDNVGKYSKLLLVICSISFTILCHLFLTLYSPLHALVLGIIIYIIPVSSLLLGFFLVKSKVTLSDSLKVNMSHSGMLTLLSSVFFIIREYFSFGTVSFPSHSGLYILNLPSLHLAESGYFWASIPGALVLFSLFIIVLSILNRCYEIKWRNVNTNV